VSAQEIWVINAGARPPSKWRAERLTYAQDRLRFSEALGVGDDSQRNRAAVIHRLPQHRLGVGSLLDRRPWAHTSTAGLRTSETAQRGNRRTSMNDPAAKIRVLYSVPEAMALLNLSRTQIYELIRTSRLVTVTQGVAGWCPPTRLPNTCSYCSPNAGAAGMAPTTGVSCEHREAARQS
jgi:hypothetical protein